MDRVRFPVAFTLLLVTALLLVGCEEGDDSDTALKLGGTSPLPTVSLLANPTTVNAGDSSTLSWTSSDATSCNAGGAWSGGKSTSGNQSTGALTQTSTFTLSCTGPGGITSVPRTVAVQGATADLSWIPNADPTDGYITYFGPSAGTATTQLSVIPLTVPGFDPQAPSVEYDTVADLGLSTGDTVCFRLKAYNGAGTSGFSGAVCGTL